MNLPVPRRLTIFLAVIFVVFLAFVMTGCSQLSSKESTVDEKFSALIPELTLRYSKLSDAIDIAESVGGKRDVTNDGKKYLNDFDEAKKDKDTSRELKAARELENVIGRLRSNAASSPKLSGSAELKKSMEVLDGSIPGKDLVDKYRESIDDYEGSRTSWRLLISALIGRYSTPKQLEFSTTPQ